MRIHHICFVVKDYDNYVKFWTDFMGWTVIMTAELPSVPGKGIHIFTAEETDELFNHKDHKTRMAVLKSPTGDAMIELQAPYNPPPTLTSKEEHLYTTTGMNEFGLTVTDLDDWVQKIRAAGYKTTTSEIWLAVPTGEVPAPGVENGRNILFHDPENNLIQLSEVYK